MLFLQLAVPKETVVLQASEKSWRFEPFIYEIYDSL